MIEAGKASKFRLLRVVDCKTERFKGLVRPAVPPPNPGPLGVKSRKLEGRRVEDVMASLIGCYKLN